ncbi:PREDICTED: transposon [Prunus dulcis]|uniref:PREDICTED: transposon n=1 Tax=Prunus dulcis TaxID=3755 RepID=A0A5E4GFE7_PRUDU|nr:PREDICTED: transposon [Prunus dulcis]
MKFRKELWLKENGSKFDKPPSEYALKPHDRKAFCQFLKSVKFPDGYAANISRNVNLNDGKLSGLKSHDYHVFLQHLLSVGVRKYLKKSISSPRVELSYFFQQICAKMLIVAELEKLEKNIVLTLYKLERIFPPTFFDIMVHLAVHIPREAKLAGPVAYRPIESGVETALNRTERHNDGGEPKGKLLVFAQKLRPIEAKRRGRSYGKRLQELIEANDGKPLTVAFDPKLKAPINKIVHTLLTNEIGTSIRTHAPVCHKLWEKVPDDDKKKQIVNLLALFDVDLTQSMVSEFVEAKMARAYIVFKNRLHDHYKKVATTQARGMATLPPDSLWNKRPVEHWHWLCDRMYTEPTFVEKSNKTNHRGGACSFVQHAQQAVKEGKPLSFIDNWERLYKDKEHNWISEDAQEKHKKMKKMRDELRSKMIEEADEDIEANSIEVPIEAEFKIMGDVLGVKGRTVHGVGAFPRMEANISTTGFSGASNSELSKLQDKVQMLATNIQGVQEDYSNLRANLVAALEASNNGGLDNAQLMLMLRATLMPSATT